MSGQDSSLKFPISDARTNENVGNSQTPQWIEDYADILKEYDLGYRRLEYYLQVGDISLVQGWILHVSCIISQVPVMLREIIPILSKENVAFKIPFSKHAADCLLDGIYGYTNLGKVICIYPDNETKALDLARDLISATASFRGPDIPTDRHLGGAVYTRYGSFNPILKQEANGIVTKYIYNYQGALVPDACSIPFRLPEGVNWGFSSICSPEIPARKKMLNDRIRSLSEIKHDVKGRVIKGRYMKNWIQSAFCVVKEGKKYMYSDDYGRDIQDRLQWQLKVQNDLSSEICVPKILDSFTEGGDAYIAMDYIEGVPLDSKIMTIYQGCTWPELTRNKQLLLLGYLDQIIHMIGEMHRMGYVHRDITAENFLVNREDKLYMIDLELVYSIKLEEPSPPFALGTIGYMSPEQQACSTPTVKEDIYGLGALMFVLFTSLAPSLVDTKSTEGLRETIEYFIAEEELVAIIVDCLQLDAVFRPNLQEVKERMQRFSNKLLDSEASHVPSYNIGVSKEDVRLTLDKALNALGSDILLDKNGLWFSKTISINSSIANVQSSYSNYVGLYEGISGVFYTLFALKGGGFDTMDLWKKTYPLNLKFIDENGFQKLDLMPPGLFAGTAGFAYILAAGIKCGLIDNVVENHSFISLCLDQKPAGLDLANGVAGQGLALLQCQEYLSEDFIQSTLDKFVSKLCETQQKDGSWITAADANQMKGVKLTGLANGVSGIVSFLLAFATRYRNEEVMLVAVRGLSWLQKQAVRKDDKLIWYTNSLSREVDPWLLSGVTGIALTFIRAYESLKDPVYKQMAMKAMSNHPPKVTYRNLSHAGGIVGLGEVYLEAARVFKEEEWQKRADWIAGSLVGLKKRVNEDTVNWITDTVHSTADLMTGNCGVIHFLARWLSPSTMPYPFLPII
ncbi:class III lanthionine synthetase LanKC N-terminal domain-containing protein [Chitinophaga japonensis]|uniref:Protein kinase-like protein n=1 Tax=Chitinophaga japonensis TaxID=104662 RepID=A0A562T3B7_CHIJA|nr:lanthionine synthetase LanC family protein [Chitinophaga japonensis]TWI87774.1 protein kinase-like protein [Chitinophaga japonensis]